MTHGIVHRRWQRPSPQAIPPDLHALVAHWLWTIARHQRRERLHRTKEALTVLRMVTGWSEAEARQAMDIVAGTLSSQQGESVLRTKI